MNPFQNALKFNHMSIPSHDVAQTAGFFERYLGCTGSAFGTSQILKRPGFDIVIECASDRDVSWPVNFHIGFELSTVSEVKAAYAFMKADGVDMATEVISHRRGSRFFCWIPGGVMLEINTREDADEAFKTTFASDA